MQRLIKAFSYSIAGCIYAFRTQASFRQNVVLLLVGAIVACMLTVTPIERLALISSLMLVVIVELLDTAIETAIDRISSDMHPLSKHAKDLGSAAVLLSLLMAAIIWTTLLWSIA